MSHRICILVDVDADTPEEAYEKVHDALDRTHLAWESSDRDWYDEDGEEVPEGRVSEARRAVLRKRELRAAIHKDYTPPNPRVDYDPLGVMYCKHSRYSLGDPKAVPPKESWDEVVYKLPLFLYDHSGITMSTGPFSCKWDSGQVGWIYLTKSAVEENQITPDQYEDILKDEVRLYDHYLQGNVWGYELGNGDSCWGFVGDSLEETGILDYAPVEYHENLKKAWEKRYG